MRRTVKLFALVAASLVAACAGYGGTSLKPGTRVDEVLHVMGEPAMQWQDGDGTRQFAYPRGPWGVHTFMAHFDSAGRLLRIENVLEPGAFARIRAGMGQNEVLRLLGPPDPAGTAYFKARDELAWEWQYCNDWGQRARFNVLFDGTTGIVRSTLSLMESQIRHCGGIWGHCGCSR